MNTYLLAKDRAAIVEGLRVAADELEKRLSLSGMNSRGVASVEKKALDALREQCIKFADIFERSIDAGYSDPVLNLFKVELYTHGDSDKAKAEADALAASRPATSSYEWVALGRKLEAQLSEIRTLNSGSTQDQAPQTGFGPCAVEETCDAGCTAESAAQNGDDRQQGGAGAGPVGTPELRVVVDTQAMGPLSTFVEIEDAWGRSRSFPWRIRPDGLHEIVLPADAFARS